MNKYMVTVRHEYPGQCELVTTVEAETEWQAAIKAMRKAEKHKEMREAGRPEDLKIWIVEQREKTWSEKMAELASVAT